MKRILAIIAGLVLGSAAQAQPVPSVDDYAAMANMTSVSISPNGERIVFIAGETREDRNIIVASLIGGAPIVIDGGDDQVVVGTSWVSNEHIYVTYNQRRRIVSMAERRDIFRPYIIRVEDQNAVELLLGTRIVDIDPEDEDSVLTTVDFSSGGVVFQRQSLNEDRARRAFPADEGFQYLLNAEGEPFVRYRGGRGDTFELWTKYGTGSWHRVHTERFELKREFQFASRTTRDWVGVIESIAGLDATGRYGYFSSETMGERGVETPGRRRAVFRYDFQEEAIEGPLVSSDISDVNSFMTDWRTHAVIGVSWNEERRHVEYFDPEFRELYEQLVGFFPDSNVNIVSWDAEFRKVVINITGGHTSGAYYLIDRVTGDVTLLAASRPRIPEAAMAPVEIIHYTAQDGLELFGYLTLPPGREARNLPAVLLPHGGPESRDTYGFDPWAQFLAARGYAVFQPQFRGSSGFGVEFAERGYGHWGEEMQTDLGDGMQVLFDQGMVDPNRVCIFGWSYGGYAAFAGATLTPDLYRCVIAGAGVSDILTMMEYERDRGTGDSQAYWARNIGDWRRDPAHIRAISPAQQVDRITAPLMIIHGTDDLIVPFSQAEYMARVLDAAGKPYEMVAVQDGPHQLYRMTVDNQRELYANLERFLFQHNPPDPR
jgi:dipeptidyl aminopeptidase/acylaminoacyl peptidase